MYLEAALEYASRQIPVLPLYGIVAGRCACGRDPCPDGAGKHPDGVLAPHGVKDATTDPHQVRLWFKARPEGALNIGLAMGDDLVALDEDQNGAIVQAGLEIPNCPTSRTSRGHHYLFRSNGRTLQNGGFANGLECKTAGGYIVAPPSQHISGRRYMWEPGHSLVEVDPPPLPDAIGERIVAAHAGSVGNGSAKDQLHGLFRDLKLEEVFLTLETLEPGKDAEWRRLMLSALLSLVGRGLRDDLIVTTMRRATRKDLGFTHQQTDEWVAKEIGRARRKVKKPEPDEETFDRVDQELEPKPEIVTLSVTELLARSFTPAENVLGPWLRVKNLAMLFGPRGEGKTFLVLACIIAIASGGEFLSWSAPKRRKVLLIDGEMPGDVIQERLRSLLKGVDPQDLKDWLRVITPDSQPAGLILALNRPEDQARIAEQVDWADVIVLDNLACLTGGDENDREAWLPVQGWILRLRTQGKTVLLVHHTGKGGDQRGSSSREDVLDTVVKLKRPPDYDPAQGLRVHWHFVKHRSFFGADTLAVEVQLEDLGPLGKRWKWSQLDEDVLMRQVVEMLKDKMSIRDIAEVLDLSKSKVHRLKMRAKSIGLKV